MADFGSIRQHWNRVGISETAAGDPAATDDTILDVSGSNGSAIGSSIDPFAGIFTGTFIGSGALFEGTLKLEGDFRIDTEFRGELETDGAITVGPNGSVVGSIRAREVVICGAVVGNVYAPRQLIIEATGKLHGDLETACLEIRRHAFFRGNTLMTQPQSSRRPELSQAPETEPVYVSV